MSTQLGLFEEAKVKLEVPDPPTTVRLGSRQVQIPLRWQRRQAVSRLLELLKELEGKDVYLGSYDAGGRHFWLDNLKLPRLQLEYHPNKVKGDQNYIPGVVVLRGSRGAYVRIFTDYLVAIREQEYMGYWHYLLDFRNGFWQSPVDNFRSHYACLAITRFKE